MLKAIALFVLGFFLVALFLVAGALTLLAWACNNNDDEPERHDFGADLDHLGDQPHVPDQLRWPQHDDPAKGRPREHEPQGM